ncbi:MAG: nucleotidyltransferase family protein, partial [Synergistaceae bacterium]|nr:nucleotidyltransferase family protein [Synergistaceae bacterium]
MLTGITAELNPLHKGHESIIKYASSLPDSEGAIVLLSGNFTQRGSPAMTDKFTRAYAAVMAGAEIVIELPFVCACSGGREFSRGAVNILGRLGFVKGICFGMEDSNFDAGNVIDAMTNESEEYREILRREMSLGASYPKAASLALEQIIPGGHDFIAKPNNMLAVSYMTAAKTQGFSLKAYPYQRTGDYTSSAIRENLSANSHMLPEYELEILERSKREGRLCDENRLWPLLQSVFIRSGREE